MSEMVERVLSAISPWLNWRDDTLIMSEAAVAAIEAMREPSRAMKNAGQDFRVSLSWDDTEDLMDALIDAALSNPPHEAGPPTGDGDGGEP